MVNGYVSIVCVNKVNHQWTSSVESISIHLELSGVIVTNNYLFSFCYVKGQLNNLYSCESRNECTP